MAISFLDNVTLGDNQLQNVVIQVLASDPTGVTGKLIYNSTSNVLKYYNGSGWISLTADTGMTSWTVTADNGSSVTVGDGQTVDWAGGQGITTAYSTPSGNRTVTTTLDEATTALRGGIRLYSDTDQSVAANAVTTTAARTYGIQLNSDGQAVVNVPWTDTTTTVELNFDASDGSSSQVANNGTMTFAQGTGITTTGNDAGTLTITNSKPFDGLTLASTSGSNSTIANSGTITLAAGAGITTTNNGSGQITIEATGSGSMSSFTLTGDSGSNQTISDGNTLDVAGGTNISTVVGNTDTVTVNLDDSITLAGDLTVNGGDITLGGTGRIQGVDTVTAGTDAANKTYVDNSVVGNLIFQGGYDAANNEPDLDSSPSSNIKKGWSYVVTVGGAFFTETVEVGDFLIAKQDAPTTLANWVTVQNNTDLATASTVGIGNTNIEGPGSKDGLSLGYSAGTATVGLDINSLPSLTALNTNSVAVFYDPSGDDNNVKVSALNIAAGLNSLATKKLTTTSQTTHTFTHNLNTFDVMVQLYDTSSKETVYASVDRTSVNVVTATTAASASLTALIQKIG